MLRIDQGPHHQEWATLNRLCPKERNRISFHGLIARAREVSDDVQLTFTTSEDKDMLREAVSDLPLRLVDGYVPHPHG